MRPAGAGRRRGGVTQVVHRLQVSTWEPTTTMGFASFIGGLQCFSIREPRIAFAMLAVPAGKERCSFSVKRIHQKMWRRVLGGIGVCDWCVVFLTGVDPIQNSRG